MRFFKKFKESVFAMNETSQKLIKHGLQLAVGISLIGTAAFLFNKQAYIFNYMGEQYSVYIIAAGASLFAQFIIGGLVLDIWQKKRAS